MAGLIAPVVVGHDGHRSWQCELASRRMAGGANLVGHEQAILPFSPHFRHNRRKQRLSPAVKTTMMCTMEDSGMRTPLRKRGSLPPKKTGYHHGSLRDALLQSALHLIERDGVPALTLRKVAAGASVSHTAPYHHFASRAALYSELAIEVFVDCGITCKKPTTAMRRSVAPVARNGRGYILFAVSHPGHFRLMFSPELLEEDHAELREVRRQC